MPDWFYRTVSQPLLLRLPAPRARDFALGFIGRLSRLPFGPFLIDFLGHMRADPRLRQSFFNLDFPTAIGLGPWLDTRVVATEALSRFGVGFIEIGPVTLHGSDAETQIKRLKNDEALWIDEKPDSVSLAACNTRLKKGVNVPIIVRIGAYDDEEIKHLISELDPSARLINLTSLKCAIEDQWSIERWSQHLESALTPRDSDQASAIIKRRQGVVLEGVAAGSTDVSRHVLLSVPADADLVKLAPLLDVSVDRGVAGFVIDGSIKAEPAGRLIGLPAREPSLQLLRWLRDRSDVPIIASGGVHEPEDVLEFLSSGASLVQIDTGLIYTGPGLPKRVNDCLLFEVTRNAGLEDPPPRPSELTWFWTTLMGAGMVIGGVLAWVIAATKVVLPYDEVFLGMSIGDLTAINPRLLAFMAHDRVTLAGVMLAIGILYVGLSVFGVRRGLHWARQSVLISAFTGFVSFFLFLGFGYLDTFHAFVTAALLQLLLLGVHARLGLYIPQSPPDRRSDGSWRLGLWGQLLLVVHGFALLAAGVAISVIGITQVFVSEDLEFLGTTAAALAAANPRLVPLVAHDRATLGGMLLASGWMFLLPALWGFRRNSPWLWWSLLIAGTSAYIAATGVHHAVGYLSFKHLLPAFGGFALMLLGLGLSYPFLCRKNPHSV